jgi:hypothetical protein
LVKFHLFPTSCLQLGSSAWLEKNMTYDWCHFKVVINKCKASMLSSNPSIFSFLWGINRLPPHSFSSYAVSDSSLSCMFYFLSLKLGTFFKWLMILNVCSKLGVLPKRSSEQGEFC